MHILRGTLTLVKGSRLEALFSGRWESKLLRDDEGSVFLDLDPVFFKKIVRYLYSIKVREDSSDFLADEVELPKFNNAHDQEVFDVYVDFFRLKQYNNESSYRTSGNGNRNTTGQMSTTTTTWSTPSRRKRKTYTK